MSFSRPHRNRPDRRRSKFIGVTPPGILVPDLFATDGDVFTLEFPDDVIINNGIPNWDILPAAGGHRTIDGVTRTGANTFELSVSGGAMVGPVLVTIPANSNAFANNVGSIMPAQQVSIVIS